MTYIKSTFEVVPTSKVEDNQNTMTYQEIVEGIKSLKIQGAEKIAIAAVEAFAIKLKETSEPAELEKARAELVATRSTEPALRNALAYCMANYKTNPEVATYVIDYFKTAKQKIAEFGAKKIADGMIVFTHCHSSTVVEVFRKAHEQGKKFTVYNTETRPRFQGRITAEEVAKLGIPVVHFVDSAGHTYMKKADIFIFGCDAISADGRIYNKIGTEALAEFALQKGIPVFSVTNSWKFDPKTLSGFEEEIEQRDTKEVWENPPAGVTVNNPAFEIIPPDIVTGIITELGDVKPESLINEVRKNYPWMFTQQ
jgi:ribose 1,5-bisphosphate isomerase